MKNLLYTKPNKKQNRGLKGKVYRDIFIITLVVLALVFFIVEARASEPRRLISPLSMYDSMEMTSQAPLTITPDVKEYIKTIFGKEWKTAYAIARAESGLRPTASHISEVEYSIGIFQINIQSVEAKVHWSRIPGKTLEEKKTWLEDPYQNVLMAYWIASKSGFYPWSVYQSGSYKNYL